MIDFLAMARPHAVAVPMPAQGHLNPLMRFCTALASRHGFLITFVNIQPIHDRILAAANPNSPSELDEADGSGTSPAADARGGSDRPLPIRRVSIPIDGIDLTADFRLSLADLLLATRALSGPLESLLQSIRSKGSGLPPVTCVISDVLMSETVQGVAEKLDLPWVSFFPSSQSSNLLHLYTTIGRISVQDYVHLSVERSKPPAMFCDGLPGLPPLFNRDMPSFKHIVEDGPRFIPLAVGLCSITYKKASAIAVNTFEELEGPAILAMAEHLQNTKLFSVGPLVAALEEESSTSLWREEKQCLPWLDLQPARSVLFISFGSITLLSEEQFSEVLEGLLLSGCRFLWSLRPDLLQNHLEAKVGNRGNGDGDGEGDGILPKKFLKAVKDRSFFVNWAPQVHVLNHPSVGGFLTHCGWNSTMEAIAAGVPMLCWPYLGDQHLDTKFITEIWQVGLRFESSQDRGDGLVTRQEVAALVQALMEGEEGILLRERSALFRHAALRSLQSGGSFERQLEAFVQHICRASAGEHE